MTAHRAFNAALVIAIGACAGILGPALDDPYVSPAQAAHEARNAQDPDGTERLTKACRQRYGAHAEVRWADSGQPVCALFSSGGEMVATRP